MAEPTTSAARQVGTLTAADLGSEIAVINKGRLYVGTLSSVEHKAPWSGDGPAKTSMILVGDAGWRWHGFMESTDTLTDAPPKVEAEDA